MSTRPSTSGIDKVNLSGSFSSSFPALDTSMSRTVKTVFIFLVLDSSSSEGEASFKGIDSAELILDKSLISDSLTCTSVTLSKSSMYSEAYSLNVKAFKRATLVSKCFLASLYVTEKSKTLKDIPLLKSFKSISFPNFSSYSL